MTVIVHIWPSMGSRKEVGHVALQTTHHYVSFYPGTTSSSGSTFFKEKKQHSSMEGSFHSHQLDVHEGGEAPVQIRFESLDERAIEDAIAMWRGVAPLLKMLCSANSPLKQIGRLDWSMFSFDPTKCCDLFTYNCSSLVLLLLKIGGIGRLLDGHFESNFIEAHPKARQLLAVLGMSRHIDKPIRGVIDGARSFKESEAAQALKRDAGNAAANAGAEAGAKYYWYGAAAFWVGVVVVTGGVGAAAWTVAGGLVGGGRELGKEVGEAAGRAVAEKTVEVSNTVVGAAIGGFLGTLEFADELEEDGAVISPYVVHQLLLIADHNEALHMHRPAHVGPAPQRTSAGLWI